MESNKEENNKKEEKNFELSLKQIKQVENGKKFQKLTDVLIAYNILPFFTIKEAREIGKSDSKLYNAFVRYFKRNWESFKNKYNIKYEGDCKPNGIYEQKDDQGHFIKLSYHNSHLRKITLEFLYILIKKGLFFFWGAIKEM